MVSNPFPRLRAPALSGSEVSLLLARGRIPVLDGLRGLAVLLVVVHNTAMVQKHAGSLLLKATYFVHAPGWVGVPLFFALSGFLITGNLVDSKGSPGVLRAFWARRALRIFPLYYTALFAITVLAPALLRLHLDGIENRVWFWVYVNNWFEPIGRGMPDLSHFWSLAVEEQFYFVWPFVVLALSSRALLRACLGLAVAAVVFRVGLWLAGAPPLASYMFTFARMDALTLGAAAALVVRDDALIARVAPYLRGALVACVATCVAMWPFSRGFNRDVPPVQIVGYSALAIFFAALVLFVTIVPSSRVSGALSAPWLRWLGKYSYAIYVLHLPIAHALQSRFSPYVNADAPLTAFGSLVAFELIVGALSIGAALVSWAVIEKPALALKDRIAPMPKTAR